MKPNLIKNGFLTALLIFLLGHVSAQSESPRNSFRLVFYNVENYFDTLDNPQKKDEEFTPSGPNRWGFYRYKEKQTRIAKTIIAAGQWKVPALVGLAEIENRRVLKDLLVYSPLSEFDYQILHKSSPDWRGIDVALLYRESLFEPLDTQFIKVDFKKDEHSATRDILYAKGIAEGKDTLHVFVNHWPSRYGGKAETDPKRMRAARILRTKVDSIFSQKPKAKVIITGDFNDEPENKSLKKALKALKPEKNNRKNPALFNLMYNLSETKEKGTYKYKYKWNTFDQFIVSGAMLSCQSGFCTNPENAHVYRADFLLKPDSKYPGKKPHRTFVGPRYKDGFSDHLPVYLDLIPKEKKDEQ